MLLFTQSVMRVCTDFASMLSRLAVTIPTSERKQAESNTMNRNSILLSSLIPVEIEYLETQKRKIPFLFFALRVDKVPYFFEENFIIDTAKKEKKLSLHHKT